MCVYLQQTKSTYFKYFPVIVTCMYSKQTSVYSKKVKLLNIQLTKDFFCIGIVRVDIICNHFWKLAYDANYAGYTVCLS